MGKTTLVRHLLADKTTKSPKLYVTDVGLACALLGIETASQVQNHPLRGALFETMVVNEFLKNRCNAGTRAPLYFWRDNIGTEVDLILERGNELAAVETKSGIAVASDAFGNLKKWQKYALERGNFSAIYPGLVYGGSTRHTRLLRILSDLPPVTRIQSDTQRNSTPNKNGDRSPRHHASTVKISRPPGP
ncbi:MAG: DUF4143 domain-containing protein [Comamonadaceae bacterium]|nr:MAG: DUF4143 domain-containing protein [Comamonadaceae bacterium]